jgi:hypothetical protein
MLLFGIPDTRGVLASAKGIAITAAIVAGIIGASLAIWFMPQQNPTATNITDEEGAAADIANLPADNLSYVYTAHTFALTEVDNAFNKWANGSGSAEEANAAIDRAASDIDDLRARVDTPGVPADWQESYGLYSQALDKFEEYLGEMKEVVASGSAEGSQQLDALRDEMDDLVDRAIAAFPT